MFVVQRGILVTAIQTAVLIAFFAAPNNLTWSVVTPLSCLHSCLDIPILCRLALHMNVTRLYANTFCEKSLPPADAPLILPPLVAMLNGRSYLRDKHGGSIITNFNTSQSGGQLPTPHRAENINLDPFPSNRNVSQLSRRIICLIHAHAVLSPAMDSRSTKRKIG